MGKLLRFHTPETSKPDWPALWICVGCKLLQTCREPCGLERGPKADRGLLERLIPATRDHFAREWDHESPRKGA